MALAAGAPGELVPLPCDLSDRAAVDALFAAIEADGGPVPALAHCAASVNYQPADEITFESFQAVVSTTLFTAFNTVHRWGLGLLAAGSPGCAVTLTSTVAHRGTPGVAHSSAGKAGIEGFVRSIAREWGPRGIRVNCVGPGVFPVEKSAELWGDPDRRPAMFEHIAVGLVRVVSTRSSARCCSCSASPQGSSPARSSTSTAGSG